MSYRLGIDAGSKTIKLVLLDGSGNVCFSQYQLHRSDIRETALKLLHDTVWRFGDYPVAACVTGSAGMRLAEVLRLPHIQEVIALRAALAEQVPDADVAIELGGEDAKIVYLTNGIEQRMNGSCAGGTGGFIDTMAGMLGVRARELNSLALGYQTIYPIASRCAVFAQSDVRPLLNEGARKSDVAASILQAVVNQTISGLACGRPITGKVVFVGGPFEVYSELVSRFRNTLGLLHNQVVKPRDAQLFVALGAALSAGQHPQEPVMLSNLEARLQAATLQASDAAMQLPPLFESDEQLQAFKQRHAGCKLPRAKLHECQGDLFLGLDAGSTALKLALIDTAGNLLYSDYRSTKGSLVETAREALQDFYARLPRDYGGQMQAKLRRTAATGYGEQLLVRAFGADFGEVETIAHLRAARQLEPQVDLLLDIGGQDIKCLRVNNGIIDDVMLNESCSSGCGALVEGFSRSLGYNKWSFSELALSAKQPVDLGTRCTVFMTSRVRHAQKQGISAADIAAGLAYSVVRNALYKVIGCTDAKQLGRRIMVQGGTFLSDAVLRAFELECQCQVLRPDAANLMGAYGAALLARDQFLVNKNVESLRCVSASGQECSRLLGPEQLMSLCQHNSSRHCKGCSNNCLLSIAQFTIASEYDSIIVSGRGLVTGNRCERGLSDGEAAAHGLPNLYALEQRLISDYNKAAQLRASTENAVRRPLLGIPAVLELYESYPFWVAFFSALGFRCLRFEGRAGESYRQAAAAVLSEGMCYPAKLVYGHLHWLAGQDVDYIFMPVGGSVAAPDCVAGAGRDGHCPALIDCPLSTNCARLVGDYLDGLALPEDIQSGIDAAATAAAAGGGRLPRLLSCDLRQQDLRMVLKQMLRGSGLPVEDAALDAALDTAVQTQERFYVELGHQSDAALQYAEDNGLSAVVLAGHPYHVDPDLNHGIDSLLTSLGFVVLSSSGLLRSRLMRRPGKQLEQQSGQCSEQRLGEQPRQRSGQLLGEQPGHRPGEGWTRPHALYRVATLAAGHPNIDLVHLHSFGCGVDALATDGLRRVLEAFNKPYTALKIDEMVNLATVRIRLRSLAAAINQRRFGGSVAFPDPDENTGWGQQLAATGRGRQLPQPLPKQPPQPPFQPPSQPSFSNQTTIWLPALAPKQMAAAARMLRGYGYNLQLLSDMDLSDLHCGLSHLSNDLCYPMTAIAGQLIAWAKGMASANASRQQQPSQLQLVLIPQVCAGCRSVELEKLVAAELKNANLDSNIRVVGFPSTDATISLSPKVAQALADCLDAPDVPDATVSVAAATSSSRIAVLGNAALLHTPFLNQDIIQRIQAEGCIALSPPLTSLLLTNAPLERHIASFVSQGVKDFIYLQSFGCLSGHVYARGAARRIARQWPGISVTFIEFDSGSSEINQLNRLKLAISIAKERAAAPSG